MSSVCLWVLELDYDREAVYCIHNLKERQYSESESGKIAKYIEINDETIKRNDSLGEFSQCLANLSNQ